MRSFTAGEKILDAKAVAARKAVELVLDGMTIGLGSGTTATFAIQFIGERIRAEGLKVTGVPTSSGTNSLASEVGIPLVPLKHARFIDITIDGADEVDPDLHLIKGGGGALVREKLVAAASKEVVIICDDSKIKPVLGQFPLPVTVVPFGWEATRERLLAFCPEVVLRMKKGSSDVFVTDDGALILDLHMSSIPSPAVLEAGIKAVTGVIEVGLFVNLATSVVIGHTDGTTNILVRAVR